MEKLKAPSCFPFPFEPYRIQKDFMTSLYTALEEGKLGIFESPTGTGKSLSLICGALQWLTDHERNERAKLQNLLKTLDESSSDQGNKCSSDPFDWLNQQAEQVQARQKKIETKLKLDYMDKYEIKISKIKQASKQRKLKTVLHETPLERVQKKALKSGEGDDDDDLLLEEMDSSVPGDGSDDEELLENVPQNTKIYFCSRTHSQLAQFVGEIKRSPFGSNMRVVTLASRQNTCINEAVNKLKNLSLINEKCLDLQKKKQVATEVSSDGKICKKSRKGKNMSSCQALSSNNIQMLSEDILTEVQDIEEIVKAGRKNEACPYYASRASAADAQVVVVPYNTILHKATRKACGIQLKNNILIIDEAHNLLEAIGSIHSAQVNGYQLSQAYGQLVQYRDRYQSRFNPKTLLLLGQIIFVVKKLIIILGGKAGGNPEDAISTVLENKIFTLADFVLSTEIDNLNLYKLLEFCQSSKVSHKLCGFAARYPIINTAKPGVTKNQGIRSFLKVMETENNRVPVAKPSVEEQKTAAGTSMDGGNNPFLSVLTFMETLTNSCDDGRILLKRGQTVGKGTLKFLLLNPSAHFQDIILQARSVIVAGGTMQPISEFQDQLFLSAGGHRDRISVFSCGHIIPPENILPMALGSGPSGKSFEFSYLQRDSSAMVAEMGRFLINLCNFVPAGIVCFFPSYDYEKYVIDQFSKTDVLAKIELKKKVFREPKQSSEVEGVLSAYASCIRHSKTPEAKLTGAILFSVIGGKLSEGLNFSDDLGRCVVVVGLPFPNIKSVELQEQMKFLDSSVGTGSGQRHYENLCMKAVNQSIGRAVRHQNDYAAVVLLDQRYLQKSRQAALPDWIKKSLESHERFGSAFGSLRKFFQARRTQQ